MLRSPIRDKRRKRREGGVVERIAVGKEREDPVEEERHGDR